MGFKPSISQTDNEVRELDSVSFVEDLLRGKYAKTHLSVNDKTADIDGTIDLLDEERRLMGKLTVQVKTVGPSDEGKYRYPCPTALFGYAQRIINETVLLLAVDHSSKTVLWKHVSQDLVLHNQTKSDQGTITLYFNEDERLSIDNVPKTIDNWKLIFKKGIQLILNTNKLNEENENLRKKMLTFKNSVIKLPDIYISKLQSFIDIYNKLLDNEFIFIKNTMFPNCWKRGIGVHAFGETRLDYSLYSIRNGEISPLLKQLPDGFFDDRSFDFASVNSRDNNMNVDPYKFALSRIRSSVKKFVKQNRIIPSDDDFLSEYVRDFTHDTLNSMRLDPKLLNDIKSFMAIIESKYFINGRPVSAIFGYRAVNVPLLYECLSILHSRGYNSVKEVYPSRGNYSISNWVSSWFTADMAQSKLEAVANKVIDVYDGFIHENFPMIAKELKFFNDFDTLVVEMLYPELEMPQIIFYKLKRIDNTKTNSILFSPVNRSVINEENDLKTYSDIYRKSTLKYKGANYQIISWSITDGQNILFNRFNLLGAFYQIMELRMNKLFENRLGHDYKE